MIFCSLMSFFEALNINVNVFNYIRLKPIDPLKQVSGYYIRPKPDKMGQTGSDKDKTSGALVSLFSFLLLGLSISPSG